MPMYDCTLPSLFAFWCDLIVLVMLAGGIYVFKLGLKDGVTEDSADRKIKMVVSYRDMSGIRHQFHKVYG